MSSIEFKENNNKRITLKIQYWKNAGKISRYLTYDKREKNNNNKKNVYIIPIHIHTHTRWPFKIRLSKNKLLALQKEMTQLSEQICHDDAGPGPKGVLRIRFSGEGGNGIFGPKPAGRYVNYAKALYIYI